MAKEKAEEEFAAWLATKLDELSLGDDAYVQYVKDIVCMESNVSDDAEKEESLKEFLGEAAGGAPVDGIIKEVMEYWKVKSVEVAAILKEQQSTVTIEEVAKSIIDKPQEAPVQAAPKMDARLKAALVSQYSYAEGEEEESGSEENEDDEEGRPRKPPTAKKERQARKGLSAADIAATFENTNAQRVLDSQKSQREGSKSESAARAARDKAALAADRESKAKRKEERQKATQKGERRS